MTLQRKNMSRILNIQNLYLAFIVCLISFVFVSEAKAGFTCQIYKANVILNDQTSIQGYFYIISFDEPYETGKQIQEYLKVNQWPTLTVYRKLQTIRYPEGQVYAATHKDTIEVKTNSIKTIEYLGRMNCQSENEPSAILSLQQSEIDLLQKVPFASVKVQLGDNRSEVCLSYDRKFGRAKLREICGKSQSAVSEHKASGTEKQSTRKTSKRGIIVIELTSIP